MTKMMNKPDVRPRRSVAIDASGPSPKVYLEDTERLASRVEYVALSYCWGGVQHVKATKNVLAQLHASISFETLPATLKDAIVLFARLNHKYVWIDAL